jgi:hypothetical protein
MQRAARHAYDQASIGSNGASGMTSIQDMREDGEAMVSPSDLKQIRDAVSALRALHPGSVLADLVEEKLRRIENDGLPHIAVPQAPEWRLFW